MGTMNPVTELQQARTHRLRPDAAWAGPATAASWRALAEAAGPQEAATAWLELQCRAIGAPHGGDPQAPGVDHGLVLLRQPDADEMVPVALWPQRPQAADLARFNGVVHAALGSDGAGATLMPLSDGRVHIAWPLRLDGRIEALAVLELAAAPGGAMVAPVVAESVMRQLQWGAGVLQAWLWQGRSGSANEQRLRMGLVLDLVAHLLEQPRLEDGLLQVSSALAAFLGCERVSIGLALPSGAMRLQSLSMATQFDRSSNLVRAIEAAMDEAASRRTVVVWPGGGAAGRVDDAAGADPNVHADAAGTADSGAAAPAHARLGHEQGCCAAASTCLWAPSVRPDDVNPLNPLGVLTAERSPPAAPFNASELRLLEAVGGTLGPLVQWRQQASRSLAAHARDAVRGAAARAVGRERLGAKLAALSAAAALALSAVLPATWHVSATTRIEGSLRRVVAAPFSGYVRQVDARVGDTVKAGHVLATLDDRDLKLERQRHAAAHEALQKQLREALAAQDPTQLKILESQARQEQAQMALIDEQLSRGNLTAPFDGVVLAGDLSQSLGAAVERGQVLFEVAPLDAYRVMLEVEERHIGAVAIGQTGELTLAALPAERWGFRVKQITPVNTARDGRNLFTVEAELLQPGARLRPGMEGVGKINAGERPLLWVWTHDLIGRARYAVWGWLP